MKTPPFPLAFCVGKNVGNKIDNGKSISQPYASKQHESQTNILTSPITKSLSHWQKDDTTAMYFSLGNLSPMQASPLIKNNVTKANANIMEETIEGIDNFSMMDSLSNHQFSPMQKGEQTAFFHHYENPEFYSSWESGNDKYHENSSVTPMQENITQMP